MSKHPNVVNVREIAPRVVERGQHRFTRRSFTKVSGNQQLGGSLLEIAPGARSAPHHYHWANEEAAYVISGRGKARIGDATIAIEPGDWLAFPVGPAHAHQLINDGDAPLVVLVVATDHKADVIGYPDSNKLMAYADGTPRLMRGDGLDYWDGEPNA